MSRRELVFRPQASADLREAIEWYDEHSVALALRFRHVMFETFDDFADVLVERGVQSTNDAVTAPAAAQICIRSQHQPAPREIRVGYSVSRVWRG